MTRLLVPIIAFALGLGAALALVSCGDDEEGLLPGGTAEEILANLETVEKQADAGDCAEAAEAADQVAAQIDKLGPDVSNRLKRALSDGAARLESVVDTCEEEPVAPPPPDTTEIPTDETTDTVETDEDEEEEEPEETTETDTTQTTETAPTTPTTPTTPAPPPIGDDGEGSGGTGSGGIGPGRVTGGD